MHIYIYRDAFLPGSFTVDAVDCSRVSPGAETTQEGTVQDKVVWIMQRPRNNRHYLDE